MVSSAVAEAERPAASEDDGEDPTSSASFNSLIGEHVVVRTYSAGVHIGVLIAKDDKHVLLRDARRLWTWRGAFTLSEVATKGISKSGSRMSVAVPLIELTEAVEIIPTSADARETYDAVHE